MMTNPVIIPPRMAEVILPVVRREIPEAQVVTWMPELKDRTYPLILIRRVGGIAYDAELADRPTVDIQVYHKESLAAAEGLALRVRGALVGAWKSQEVVDGKGTVNFIREMSGPNYVRDPGDNAWRIQMMLSILIRTALS